MRTSFSRQQMPYYPSIAAYLLVEAAPVRLRDLVANTLELDEQNEDQAVDDVEDDHEPDP